MSFLVPGLLFGLVLASAPIIIHLLNRRRFIRVEWAPMEYLKLTLRSNRRKLRLEQWLLLALRTLAVVALILAVARPVGSGLNLAELLRVNGRASRVVVLDDSLSMASRSGGRSAFDRGKQTLARILSELGPEDGVTVLTTSAPDRPLLRDVQLEESTRQALLDSVGSLPQTQAANSWRSTFEAVDSHLKSAAFPLKEILLITDLTEPGWSGDLDGITNDWEQNGVTLRIFDVGRPPTGNRVLAALERVEPVVLSDTPARFIARIRNDGGEAEAGLPGRLIIDGVEQTVDLPPVDAGSTVDLPLTLTFDRPGQHEIVLQLPDDELPDDNERRLVVDVRREVQVTLIDGDPGLHPFESATDFLNVAITAGNSPWRTTQRISTEWMQQPLVSPDVLILADVDSLSEERIAALEELVSVGMGLMIYPGDQVSLEAYNERLWKEGRGLLPARLETIRDVDVRGLIVDQATASSLAPLAKLTPAALSRIRPRRILDVSVPAVGADDVRILARWDDPLQSPAVLERRFGKGRVLLWTVTADRDWSDWPTENSFVLATRLAAAGVASQVSRGENLLAGQPLIHRFEVETPPTLVDLSRVDPRADDDEVRTERVAVSGGEDGNASAASTSTALAGFYRVDWTDALGNERSRVYAVSADTSDSRLVRLGDEALQTPRLDNLLGRLDYELHQVEGDDVEIAAAGAEWWRPLIAGVLLFLFTESVLAGWIDRAR